MSQGLLTFSQLGNYGQLGNQLFQMASIIGIAKENHMQAMFPMWKYREYFSHDLLPYLTDSLPQKDYGIKEPEFHYQHLTIDRSKTIDLIGYFQSEKYFYSIKDEIQKVFSWCPKFKSSLYGKYKNLFGKPTVAIHIRRGDYVGNTNYYPIDYPAYIKSCLQLIDKEVNILVFSNDLEYAKSIGTKEWNYISGSETEDLCLGSICDYVIMSNSSFSWWMAWLGEDNKQMIFRPKFWNDGQLLQSASDKDICPKRWVSVPDKILFTPDRADLTDVTFCLPTKVDCPDRRENIILSLCYLRKYFKTKIMIYEQSEVAELADICKEFDVVHKHFSIKDSFERTLLLNEMAHDATTPYIVNWDCDVFLDPDQLIRSVKALREDKVDGIYPYDGQFLRVNRSWYDRFLFELDVKVFEHVEFTAHEKETISLGGAILWNKAKFIEGGMENQFFVHYGPEDVERYERFTKLGYRIGRAKGPLYHMNHSIIYNGAYGHEYLKSNNYELSKIQHMTSQDLREYVNSWPWRLKNWGVFEDKPTALSTFHKWGVDMTYVVNLPARKDRLESVHKQLDHIGLKFYCVFAAVDGHKLGIKHADPTITPGMIGCFESHKAILKEAIDKGYERILVIEDDIVCIDDFDNRLKKALDLLPEDWQFIHFGHTEYDDQVYPWKENYLSRVNESWVVPSAVWGTHAYAIQGKAFIKEMYQVLSVMEQQVDVQMYTYLRNNRHIKNYAVHPALFYQNYKKHGTDIQVPQIQEI